MALSSDTRSMTPRLTKKVNAKKFHPTSFLKVIVGKGAKQQHFLVHEGIICERSEFFRRALNGRWTEASDRIVKLPEDSADIFNAYMNLIYTGDIPLSTTPDYELSELVELYILADKLQDASTKNTVIKSIINSMKQPDDEGIWWTFGPATIKMIYAETPQGSPLRRLAIDSLSDLIWTDTLRESSDIYPNAFLADVAIAALKNCKKPSAYQQLRKSDGVKYVEDIKIEKDDA